jgi:2-polyprenyl-6-methoxyphenol hydroxylase-like FAD-dependent oxidoreductase
MATHLQTQCCIAGGGPAGMMLGLLLARAGLDVIVLEKHSDFLRDFRGDTIHPSTLELMHELGVLDEFLKRPHQEMKQLGGQIGDQRIQLADFSHLPTRCKFIAMMPQWDFLNFLALHATRYPSFQLRMNAEVTNLLYDGERIAGAVSETPEGELEVRAHLTVAADGRGSIVRELAGLKVEELGAPIDVLWFRIARQTDDPSGVLGRIARGKIMVMLNRDEYWQCGFVIPKGEFENLKKKGIEEFRANVVAVAPFLQNRVSALQDWNEIRLLTVKVDRLRKWYREGLLCIGDAAHAMSPVGGVGINLAVQDAVAAANLLYDKLLRNDVTVVDLEEVQKRRLLPTRLTQAGQVFIQKEVLRPALQDQETTTPWFFKLFNYVPFLRRLPAYLVGVGVRAEHVRTPEA